MLNKMMIGTMMKTECDVFYAAIRECTNKPVGVTEVQWHDKTVYVANGRPDNEIVYIWVEGYDVAITNESVGCTEPLTYANFILHSAKETEEKLIKIAKKKALELSQEYYTLSLKPV
jgi:hypothetical protein